MYFQSVNKTFLSYWFTILKPQTIINRAINNKIQNPVMFIFGNKIKELFHYLYIEIISYFARD